MIRFANPEYIYLLIIVPVLILFFLYYRSWKKNALRRFGDHDVIRQLMPNQSHAKGLIKLLIILIGITYLVFGLLDPQVGSKLEKVKREGIDLYLVLDVSNSMLAEDIKPNRLERSKLAISNLIDKLEGDRIGIIIFAGNAYKQLPLTTDYSAARLFLSVVDTKIVPSQGTAIGEAIDMATISFGETDHNKAVVVITDGENHEDDAVGAAKKANELGIKIFTVGMGLPEGAPIPIGDNGTQRGFKKDREGKTVITKLDEDMLRKIAASGGGSYARANNSTTGLNKIFDDINAIDKKEIETRQYTNYEDRFQLFIAVALILFLLELLIADRRASWTNKIDFFGKSK